MKSTICLIGGLFLLIGLGPMFSPESFIEGFGLSLTSAEGAGTIRAFIGGHYLAMGGVTLFAVVRQKPMLLYPIAAIEVMMVVARGMAAVNGEFSSVTVVPTLIEVFAAAALITAAMKLPAPAAQD